MSKIFAAATTAAVLLVSAQASAKVIWRGDYETGDLSQWDRVQAVADDRLQIVKDKAKEGSFALKAIVHAGDNPIGASGNRNELAYMSLEPSGTERYFRWQTKFPEDYPNNDTWQLFTQWHHIGPNGSPPVQFYVRGEKIILSVDNVERWSMPLQRGKWLDFVFHVKWSSDPAVGFVELMVDGKTVLPKTYARTQFPGEVNYLKQGLYRDAKVSQTAYVLHDGMTVATELADVGKGLTADSGGSGPFPEGQDPTLEDFEDAFAKGSQGGCSVGAGGPVLGAVFALGALLRRRRRSRA